MGIFAVGTANSGSDSALGDLLAYQEDSNVANGTDIDIPDAKIEATEDDAPEADASSGLEFSSPTLAPALGFSGDKADVNLIESSIADMLTRLVSVSRVEPETKIVDSDATANVLAQDINRNSKANLNTDAVEDREEAVDSLLADSAEAADYAALVEDGVEEAISDPEYAHLAFTSNTSVIKNIETIAVNGDRADVTLRGAQEYTMLDGTHETDRPLQYVLTLTRDDSSPFGWSIVENVPIFIDEAEGER